MDFQVVAAGVFVAILTVIVLMNKKKLEMQKILFPLLYIILYRSKWGLDFMKKTANKHPRLMKALGSIGVVIGFIGMIFISVQLIMVFADMLRTPDAPSGVAPVLPVPVEGAVYVPFFFWIISLFIIATVHEFSHGIISNVHKIPVRSSGFAVFGLVLPIIPAAFVEPDEKILQRKSAWKQLSVFAAGPFSNILLAFLVLGLMLITVNPLAGAAYIDNGVTIQSISENTSASAMNLTEGELILEVNNNDVLTIEEFVDQLDGTEPGDMITLTTNASAYSGQLGEHPSEDKGYLGVTVAPSTVPNEEFVAKYGMFSVRVIEWFSELFFWLYVLNLGIGLFNLLPLGIVDGGRMLQIVLSRMSKSREGEMKAQKIWKIVSLAFLFIVLFMLIRSFM